MQVITAIKLKPKTVLVREKRELVTISGMQGGLFESCEPTIDMGWEG